MIGQSLTQLVTRAEQDIMLTHIVRCPEVMQAAAGRLRWQDFDNSEAAHRLVWTAAQKFHEEHHQLIPRSILEVTLDKWISQDSLLNHEHIRHSVFTLVEFIFGWPVETVPISYARNILQQFLWQRQVGTKLLKMVQCGYAERKVWESIQETERRIDLAGEIDLNQYSAGVRLLASETFAPATFVSTGYAALDEKLGGGLANGETTTLYAATSMGKSTFMVNMAVRMAMAGVSVAIISLEMTAPDIWKLALGICANVPRYRVRRNTLTPQETLDFNTANQALRATSLYVLDRRAFPTNPSNPVPPDMAAVGAVIRDGVSKHGCQVVFLDYLSKIGPHDDDDVTRLPKLTNWAFDMAQRTGAHIVGLAQANKAAYASKDTKKSNPRTVSLADVKGVVEAVCDFDNVIGLVRDDWNTDQPQDKVEMRAVVLKSRQGPTGCVQLEFHKPTGKIIEPTTYTSGASPTVEPPPVPPETAANVAALVAARTARLSGNGSNPTEASSSAPPCGAQAQ